MKKSAKTVIGDPKSSPIKQSDMEVEEVLAYIDLETKKKEQRKAEIARLKAKPEKPECVQTKETMLSRLLHGLGKPRQADGPSGTKWDRHVILDRPDVVAMPYCKEDRLFCRCGYCTIRQKLDLAKHPDNRFHREDCLHCRDKQDRKCYNEFGKIVAMFEVCYVDTEILNNCGETLAVMLSEIIEMPASKILEKIAFVEHLDKKCGQLHMAVCSKKLADKLRFCNDTQSDLMIWKSKKTHDFEDLEAFWKTRSTLQTVIKSRGSCLVVAPAPELIDLTDKSNDETDTDEAFLLEEGTSQSFEVATTSKIKSLTGKNGKPSCGPMKSVLKTRKKKELNSLKSKKKEISSLKKKLLKPRKKKRYVSIFERP